MSSFWDTWSMLSYFLALATYETIIFDSRPGRLLSTGVHKIRAANTTNLRPPNVPGVEFPKMRAEVYKTVCPQHVEVLKALS